MKKSSHTPSPWGVGRNPDSTSTIYAKAGYAIADCYGKESRANAQLISAAPELLLACERALQIIEDDRASFIECVTYSKGIEKEGQNIVDGYDAVIGIVQAAIAKAKGGAA